MVVPLLLAQCAAQSGSGLSLCQRVIRRWRPLAGRSLGRRIWRPYV